MRDLDYLKLLAKEYPTADEAAAEIVHLKAWCGMPKGTEYFFSDLHGEHRAFIHMLRSASGIIRAKVRETFGERIRDEEQQELAELIYYPERRIEKLEKDGRMSPEEQKKIIVRLLAVSRVVSAKSTRRKVRRNLPEAYAHTIDELLHAEGDSSDKDVYYRQMLDAVVDAGVGEEIISALCVLIRSLSIDTLHIIGDVFDREPRPDRIMDELMRWSDVDFQWGNHDVSWMGAAAGNTACIATVLRIATAYNCFDMLEDGYGINLRPLSMFAEKVYGDDPCECFLPHLLDENLYDTVNPSLAAKMCKAIAVIEFKLEGQLVKRHPEYGMEERLLLERMDIENGTVQIAGREYALKDTSFPTIHPECVYRLTEEEQQLVDNLRMSFLHSEKLQRHIRFLFAHGSMYLIRNGNLLFHGCIPMDADGHFEKVDLFGGPVSGRALMDAIGGECVDAFFMDESDAEEKERRTDLFWYLWCGAKSPLFGKDKMAAFEGFFVDDKALKVERYNEYYRLSIHEKYAAKILNEFGLNGKRGHIINGHVPVKVSYGELPVKANGRLFVIDGGISKAYQKKTGIAGYTLIFNSHHIALAEHKPFSPEDEDTPRISVVETMDERLLMKDTDMGKEYLQTIRDLQELLAAYRKGLLKETR